jgi:hypothetical protein
VPLPLYIGSIGTIAEALREAGKALRERGHVVLAARAATLADDVDAIHEDITREIPVDVVDAVRKDTPK